MSMSCAVNSPDTQLYWIRQRDDQLIQPGTKPVLRTQRKQRAFLTKPEEAQFYESDGGNILNPSPPDKQSSGNRFFKFGTNSQVSSANLRLFVDPSGDLTINNIQPTDEGK